MDLDDFDGGDVAIALGLLAGQLHIQTACIAEVFAGLFDIAGILLNDSGEDAGQHEAAIDELIFIDGTDCIGFALAICDDVEVTDVNLAIGLVNLLAVGHDVGNDGFSLSDVLKIDCHD